MKLINFACALESFRIEPGGAMRLEGWLVGHPAPARLELAFGGDNPARFEIRDRGRDSGDVAIHFGRTFGDGSGACRFLLVAATPPLPPDWTRAALRMTAEDGTVIDIRLDPPENLAALPPGAPAAGRALVERFESCGDNREFGLLQRRLGVARPALLAQAGVADVFALAEAIEHRFRGFAEGAALQVHPHGEAWIAAVPALRMNFHTGRRVGEVAADRVRTEERRTLQFLAGRLVDEIEDGRRIFVYRTRRDRRGGCDGTRGMERLSHALRAIGPARLLWVNEADEAHPPGTVLRRRDGLFHGFVARLAPHHDPAATDAPGWLTLLAAAAALIDADTPGTTEAASAEASSTA